MRAAGEYCSRMRIRLQRYSRSPKESLPDPAVPLAQQASGVTVSIVPNVQAQGHQVQGEPTRKGCESGRKG